MKKLTAILTAGVMVTMVLGTSAFAGDEETKQAEKQKIEFKEQTNCPVMGGKINKEVYTDIQGQRVYHCCAGCKQAMADDPDKYFEKAAAEGVVFENIQTNCPVTGEKINAEVSTYYKGRTVKFCCEDCISKFNEDPQKYLSMLDKPVDNKMKDEMSHDKMEHKGNNR